MASTFRRVGEVFGRAASPVLAPVFGATSALRRARTFHPSGDVFFAEVEPLAEDKILERAAERLRGHALVRLAGALWKNRETPDVLGFAIRFSRDRLPIKPAEDDQDLLFATFQHLITAPTALLTTRAQDFMANVYYAVAPFELDNIGLVKLRVVPLAAAPSGNTRRERILAAITAGRADFRIDIALQPGGRWRPFLRVRLKERAVVDDNALRFSPYQAGRGLRPTGLYHGLRRAVYPFSQSARGAPARQRRYATR